MEMLLVLPLLTVVLALLMFLGRNISRVQQIQVIDRYEAWRDDSGLAGGPVSDPSDPDNTAFNDAFFNGRATRLTCDHGDRFPTDVPTCLIDTAGARSANTGRLAAAALEDRSGGRTARFEAQFDVNPGFLVTWGFDLSMLHQHTRTGPDWTYAERWTPRGESQSPAWIDVDWLAAGDGPALEKPLRDLFMRSLDQALTEDPLPQHVRRLYQTRPPYIGPSAVPGP